MIMYKTQIISLVKNVDEELELNMEEIEVDLRKLGMDSIVFIQFLAAFEEKFNVDLDYDFLDKHEKISVDVLNQVVLEKKNSGIKD